MSEQHVCKLCNERRDKSSLEGHFSCNAGQGMTRQKSKGSRWSCLVTAAVPLPHYHMPETSSLKNTPCAFSAGHCQETSHSSFTASSWEVFQCWALTNKLPSGFLLPPSLSSLEAMHRLNWDMVRLQGKQHFCMAQGCIPMGIWLQTVHPLQLWAWLGSHSWLSSEGWTSFQGSFLSPSLGYTRREIHRFFFNFFF